MGICDGEFGKNVLEEYVKLKEEEERILEELKGLVKGCIVRKEISGKEYYYLVWKEGGKAKWKYLGKDVPKDLAEKLENRKKLEERLKEIRKKKKELERAIRQFLKGLI